MNTFWFWVKNLDYINYDSPLELSQLKNIEKTWTQF